MEVYDLEKIKIMINNQHYDILEWMTPKTYPDTIILNKESSFDDVICFLITYVGFNMIEDKITKDNLYNVFCSALEVALPGGYYFEAQKSIAPSCCCGIEQRFELIEDIKNHRSTWLGHDPTPDFSYEDGYILIKSDVSESNSTNCYTLKSSRSDFFKMISEAERDLIDFLDFALLKYLNKQSIPYSVEIVALMKDRLWQIESLKSQ